MDKEWLKYCATDEQLQTFNDEGYLIVEDALSSEMVDKMTIAIDRIDAEERKRQELGPYDLMKKFRTIAEDDLFP